MVAMPASQHHADRPECHDGHWRLPAGRAAISHARRVVHDALQRWGLAPGADDLVDKVVTTIEVVVAKAVRRGCGPIDLKLELHRSVHLLMGEIRDATRDLPASAGAAPPVTAIAVTYGRRPNHGGTGWYTHAFIW